MKLLARLLRGVGLIFKNERTLSGRIALLCLALKIEAKHVLTRLFGFQFGTEKIFDYQVCFPDYRTFRNLFGEIFVLQEYAFGGHEDAFIVDCGSNIGMSVLYFKKKHPRASIIAFEPDSSAFRYLAKNVERNGLQGVQLRQAAVYDDNGEIPFFSALHEDSSTLLEMSIFGSSLGNRELKSTPVKCVKLSEFIDRNVDLLKLDVQGAETRVIRELAESGKLSHVDQLIVEYHYDDVNNPLGTFLRILEENGFGLSVHARPHSRRLAPYYHFRDRSYTFMLYAYRKNSVEGKELGLSSPARS